jgi:hypothetical protein
MIKAIKQYLYELCDSWISYERIHKQKTINITAHIFFTE